MGKDLEFPGNREPKNPKDGEQTTPAPEGDTPVIDLDAKKRKPPQKSDLFEKIKIREKPNIISSDQELLTRIFNTWKECKETAEIIWPADLQFILESYLQLTERYTDEYLAFAIKELKEDVWRTDPALFFALILEAENRGLSLDLPNPAPEVRFKQTSTDKDIIDIRTRMKGKDKE